VLPILGSESGFSVDPVLTSLLNEVAELEDEFVLVLDDYHRIESDEVDRILAFLVDHRPPGLLLVIASREDPPIPMAGLRARGGLSEFRLDDLKFSADETAAFLRDVMALPVEPEDARVLEERTEGWIAGLQLAAVSLRSEPDIPGFIASFSGSHRFVLDYLIEEVLGRQTEEVQTFLLRTSVLDRFCAPLCDAVVRDGGIPGDRTLALLERSNLFLVPLDNERRWYRYHHLFAELLRGRVDDGKTLHLRASEWLENQGQVREAFVHAAAAGDTDRALRLLDSGGVPLYFRGPVRPILQWIEALSDEVRDARPELWAHYGWILWTAHRSHAARNAVERAEACLEDDAGPARRRTRGLLAALKAMLAANSYDTATILDQSRQALELLPDEETYVRTAVLRNLGVAYHFDGERSAARKAYREVLRRCESSGNVFLDILTSTGLGMLEESENRYQEASLLYNRVLDMAGRPSQPVACEAWLGLARIAYDRNDLETARDHARIGIDLAEAIEGIDTPVTGALLLARIALAEGKDRESETILAAAEDRAVLSGFDRPLSFIAELRIRLLLRRDRPVEARRIADGQELPLASARIALALGDPETALARAAAHAEEMKRRQWADELCRARIVESRARWDSNDSDRAISAMTGILGELRSETRIRTAADEGPGLVPLLEECVRQGRETEFANRILSVINSEPDGLPDGSANLSRRELEVLRLVARGLSNQEIGDRLFVSLSTVKGHNSKIFEKLGVKRRTEALVRARELGLL